MKLEVQLGMQAIAGLTMLKLGRTEGSKVLPAMHSGERMIETEDQRHVT